MRHMRKRLKKSGEPKPRKKQNTATTKAELANVSRGKKMHPLHPQRRKTSRIT
jgi:hypothetical protein